MKFNSKTLKNCRINSSVFILVLLKFLQFIYRFVFLLPPAAAVYCLRFGAEVTYQIARLMPVKKMAAGNLRLFFPAADVELLADQSLHNASYSIFELLCLPYLRAAHIKRICLVNGLENLDLALVKRKGALLVLMHTGNYEIIPYLLATHKYRFTSILKSPQDDPLFKFIDRSRRFKGDHFINVLEDNMYREALLALARNRCVGLLIDTGARESRHEMISFLGKKVLVATGWVTLALRSGAPIIPCFSKREGKKVVVTLGEPLNLDRDNKQEIMENIRLHFENLIKAHPEQWAIFLNEFEVKRMLEGA